MLTERWPRASCRRADRLPKTPLVADFARRERSIGQYGGESRTLVAKARDLRYISANALYAPRRLRREARAAARHLLEATRTRTTGSSPSRCARAIAGRTAALHDRGFPLLLGGHRAQQGAQPDRPARDVHRRRQAAQGRDPRRAAQSATRGTGPTRASCPRWPSRAPLTLFSPAHYLGSSTRKYRDKGELDQLAAKAKLKSWAALHNRWTTPTRTANPDDADARPLAVDDASRRPTRFVFERNPYFHRVDPEGRQLPYVDRDRWSTSPRPACSPPRRTPARSTCWRAACR